MKKFLFILFVTLCIMAGCDSSNEKDNQANQTISTAINHDSIVLTVEEMKDDSLDDAGYPTGTTWEHAGINDSIGFKKFVKQLKIWTERGEKEKIAMMLDYPLSNPEINNKEEFVSGYDKYFNEKVKKAVLSQKLSQIYHDVQGTRIRDGELWIKPIDGQFKITAINN